MSSTLSGDHMRCSVTLTSLWTSCETFGAMQGHYDKMYHKDLCGFISLRVLVLLFFTPTLGLYTVLCAVWVWTYRRALWSGETSWSLRAWQTLKQTNDSWSIISSLLQKKILMLWNQNVPPWQRDGTYPLSWRSWWAVVPWVTLRRQKGKWWTCTK